MAKKKNQMLSESGAYQNAPPKLRAIADRRLLILEEWRAFLRYYPGHQKTKATKLFVEAKRKVGGKISSGTLWRWDRAYRTRGLDGLLPAWRGGRQTQISDADKALFLSFWGDASRPSVDAAYKSFLKTRQAAGYPGNPPTIHAFRYLLDSLPTEEKSSLRGEGLDLRSGIIVRQRPKPLSQVMDSSERTIATGISEFDRVLSGGITLGDIILLSGEPGIGKSTLLLQMANNLCVQGIKTVYICGEEPLASVKRRAVRLNLDLGRLIVTGERATEEILATLEQQPPQILIVDSIQSLHSIKHRSSRSSVAHLQYCTRLLSDFRKRHDIGVILVGHITKEGTIAGPKSIEHLVDTILFLEGSPQSGARILKSLKHRQGPTEEIGIFKMTSKGLKEVKNPSSVFRSRKGLKAAGVAFYPLMKGSRPIVVEIHAMMTSPRFRTPPKLTCINIPSNEVEKVVNIIQRHLLIDLTDQVVTITTVGGIQVSSPTVDLALALALLSSHYNKPVGAAAVGEIGLTGEIFPVPGLKRLVETALAEGIKFAYAVPSTEEEDQETPIIEVETIYDLLFRKSKPTLGD